MKTSIALLALLAGALHTGVQAQTMFKCMQDGKTVYQAEPCPSNAQQDAIKTRGVLQPGPGADVERTIEFMSTYRACADAIRMWADEMAPLYADWRALNAVMVTRVEKDRGLQEKYRARLDAKRNGKAGMCRDVALELRGRRQ